MRVYEVLIKVLFVLSIVNIILVVVQLLKSKCKISNPVLFVSVNLALIMISLFILAISFAGMHIPLPIKKCFDEIMITEYNDSIS